MGSLGFPSKTFSCEVNVLKIKSTVEHDVDSVLGGFISYWSTLGKSLVKMLPKPSNKYSINIAIKFYEHMIPSDYFYLASVSENSILTILKVTQVSKAPCIDNLSGRFLKEGAKVLSKPMSGLRNSQLPLKSFLTFAR